MKLPNVEDFSVQNEPVLGYLPNSDERKELEKKLKKYSENVEEVPIVIGCSELRTKNVKYQVMPHNFNHKIAKFYYADKEMIEKAIQTAVCAQKEWESNTTLEERIKIWNNAAHMMATCYRQDLNAATMLGQSKTVIQAEIDSAAELEALKYQPISTDPDVTLNSMRYRGLEGFVAAVSPFNFTAIGGNLAYTPALMGNSVLWKPSDTALLSNWIIFKICREAGVPPGVVNFVPADGPVFGDAITASSHLAGINFTGSVPTFNRLWTQVGQNISKYKNFPRLIGECGGKNYHFVHCTACVQSVVNGTIRSAFEFCGQKCSACSRMYVPESLWCDIKQGLIETLKSLKIGEPTDFKNFAGAVIDKKAYDRIVGYINHAKGSPNLEIIAGGKHDDKKGYFIEPTIIETKDPQDKIMHEEIFGPVLTVYVYKDNCLEQTMKLVSETSPYALTGAVFAEDMDFLSYALEYFRNTAGNFYLNDKSTGSVVGQQPFGGARLSAGGPHYVLRWSSPQSVKETFVPLTEVKYPYMSV
ncbi:delta-1-pyrroline-5-carboxylate dehydrogenase, putative [Pediculus humanus corporis]|uniref:Multifunctional fusion protein n=1 Tax=Pediculus humanus subsp. corporis TaxID=121224 RepID=E0VB06_PEDHC|nr:delta-1-pyrroline-5-carboxylate dehydrogenase, putative [Pediculus humanus corporis]EEB10562.1 delta-1-pyrroline-5-carboxylate dehydrogenase, putative [Pediculus humanus corporis]